MRTALALAALTLLGSSAASQTFVERLQPGDLRVVSYNVLWDKIFPSEDPVQAAKFDRVVDALQPDVLNLQEIDYDTPLQDVLDRMDEVSPLPGGWHGHKEGDCVILSRWPLSMKANDTIPEGDKGLAMALVDLPDATWSVDLYVMNNHYKCCGGFDWRRQEQSDAIVNWMRDAREPGGFIDLPADTAMMVVGDLNIVDGLQPLQTLIDGNIIDNGSFGPDSPPDWDGSDSTDSHPLHNVVGPADWTWKNPGPFPPGVLDYIIYTDTAMTQVHEYVLNTTTMSPAELAATGLQEFDVTIDQVGESFDHLPVVVDFRPPVELWELVGSGLAGTHGAAELAGSGALVGGGTVSWSLTGGLPGAPTYIVIGLSQLGAPFKGGVLEPAPDIVLGSVPQDGAGELALAFGWPVGVPGGVDVLSQFWFVDAGGPVGFAASNAIRATTP